MTTINRRRFLKKSMTGGVGIAATAGGMLLHPKTVSANDKIVIGVMGLGERACFLIKEFLKFPEVEIAYICDADTRRFKDGFDAASTQKKKPQAVQDFRKMLDDKNVNALIIGAGSHWGPLATIMSCQAGKDVYVEKPFSHDIYEGRKAVEAARKYQRVVQVGSQNRSGEYIKDAIKKIRSGELGEVHFVRVLNMLNGKRGVPGPYPACPVPPEFDYDMWCGPAPKRAYNPKKTAPGVWRNFWDYSGSDSESIHQVDIARWLIGQEYPRSVHSVGRISFPERVADFPDTLSTIYDYEDLTLVFDLTWWTPNMIKTTPEIRSSDQFPHWPLNGTKIEIYGSNGMMVLGRHGGGWQMWGPKGELVSSEYGRMPVPEHIGNFLNCMKTRNKPNADVETGHISQAIVHMAYISYRLGNRKLVVDAASETFINDDEANRYLKRPGNGRDPWKIPENV